MLRPKTLPLEPEHSPSLDFARLRQQALDWLRTWCHESWTDFNASDPGVTLMEELCYVLTDLGLRTELPISRLVNRPDGTHAEACWRENSLYQPAELFPMQPLTSDDYRKLILDQCHEVLDARCTPLTGDDAANLGSIAGRYAVQVLLDPDVPFEATTASPPAARAVERLARLLDGHRNLGERFEKLETVPVVRFSLQGQVRFESGRSAADVLADAYLAVRKALLPAARHVSYAELEAQGVPSSEAFDGPLLRHGAISLPGTPWSLPRAEVEHRTIEALHQVPGLADCNVRFVFPDPDRFEAVFMLASDFAIGSAAPDPGCNSLTLDPAAVRADFHAHLARLIRARLRAAGREIEASLARSAPAPPEAMALPGLDVQTFEPIVNGLPVIYRVGRSGQHDAGDPSRRAHSRQLLGYLLIFEQLAADLAAQLAHLRDLFSNQPQQTTRFSQPLYHVPGVFPLLKGFPAVQSETPDAERHAQEAAYRENPANPYWQGWRELAESPRDFRRRRDRFLDHLLARFGESYREHDPANQETITNKERLLRHMPRLGVSRATGRATQTGGRTDRAGLEHRIELLLSRDDDSSAPVASSPKEPAGDAEPLRTPDPFYTLIEHVLFLPPTPVRIPTGEAETSPTTTFELAHFRSQLSHLLLNWTVRPLTPEFRAYAEKLIRDHAGAHLRSRILWFERAAFANPPTEGSPPPSFRAFMELHGQWVEAGTPALRLAAPPGSDRIVVYAEDVAARLFALLTQPVDPGLVGPEG